MLIGIDTGGTFTDLVALDAATGEISIVKVPSTPKQPADAPIAAIRQAEVAPDDVERIVMGTTIAINARLQKRGSTVLYIGTKGVEDTPISPASTQGSPTILPGPSPTSASSVAMCSVSRNASTARAGCWWRSRRWN